MCTKGLAVYLNGTAVTKHAAGPGVDPWHCAKKKKKRICAKHSECIKEHIAQHT
jgi:hypothetical protein